MSTAILIIDVQNAILSGKGLSNRQSQIDLALNDTVDRLCELQKRARMAGVPIVLVQHDGDEGHRLAVGTWGGLCTRR